MNKLLILFSCCISIAFGQHKKLTALLGPGFQSVPARTHIPYMETAPGCEIVPSLTILEDTSGLVYQNEYLLFRNYEEAQPGIASYVKSTCVSNEAYLQFQNWVRDSIAREKIITYSDRIEPVLKFMQYNEKELGGDKIERSRKMHALKSKHTLNWETDFNYNEPQWMPFLADMYLPQSQRFYKYRDFDKRILHYRYFQGKDSIDFFTSTITHPEFWAKQATSATNESAVLGQIYETLLPQLPVIGITGMQAHAFCHWKEMQLQSELNKKHLPYKVRVTLPLKSELIKTPAVLTLPAKDYTPQWKITGADYRSFLLAVKDSIILENLFYQLQDYKETLPDALKLVSYKERYFNEGEQEFKKLNLMDYELVRYLYPLKKDPAVFKKYREKVLEIEQELEGKLDVYKYYWVNVRSKAVIGKLKPMNWGYEQYKKFLGTDEIDSITEEPVGMDLNLDYQANKLGQGNGVRGHENYRRFIREEQIAITPQIPIENQQPNEWVKGISYGQALAYYHWKYPAWKVKAGDDWQRFVYPSEEGFERIQQGEQIKIPEHSYNFPSPVFRYVVTFIPEKN